MLPDKKLKTKNTELQETVLSRMGGISKHLLTDGSLVDWDNRQKIINAYLVQKTTRLVTDS